jgi:hypothetical protein
MTTRRDTATATDTEQVLHRLATRRPNTSRHVADERLLDDAESALSTVAAAESFASSGGFARVRTLVERTTDTRLRDRAETILSRLATIRRVVEFETVATRDSGEPTRFSSTGENRRST